MINFSNIKIMSYNKLKKLWRMIKKEHFKNSCKFQGLINMLKFKQPQKKL